MNILFLLPVLIGILLIIMLVYVMENWGKMRDNFGFDLKLSKIKLPKIKFQDSGWVLLYVICGWICFIGGCLVLVVGLSSDHEDSSSEAAIFFCFAFLASLSCFFAAHVLRLQEKTAHHAEKNSELLEILVQHTQWSLLNQTKKIKGE